jgi:flagellar protein FlaF
MLNEDLATHSGANSVRILARWCEIAGLRQGAKTPPKHFSYGGSMQRRETYSQSVHIGGASPRETEILAFGLCNARLAKVADPKTRIDALNKTHQLWSLLVRDLCSDGNSLPPPLRQDLIGLGFWAMRYCNIAILRDLPLEPLINVNQNILEGLRAQSVPSPGAKTSPAIETIFGTA